MPPRHYVTRSAGNAADRERYVTDRAQQLARAFLASADADGDNIARRTVFAAFRDLIDRGVLK